MKKLTRKDMISACVDDQITRGIVRPEDRERQIQIRLKGYGYCRALSVQECRRWYKAIFGTMPA